MKEMKNGWKKLIIALLILPLVAFFPACSCSDKEFNPGDSNTETEESEETSTPKLYLSKDSVSLKTQETATVQVKCTQNFTDFFYNATSYNTNIAQVTKSDKTITIKIIMTS